MSEDSKQLSVAELLARNGQQGATPSGGGRRRRGGRGISVAELTGDLPVIDSGNGRSAHSAPEDETPSGTSASGDDYSAAAAESYGGGQVSYHSAEPEPSHSPISGPITRYDPLAPYPPEPEAPAPQAFSSRHSAPDADSGPQLAGYSLSQADASASNGTRRGGRRRRRAEPDDDVESTEFGSQPQSAFGLAGAEPTGSPAPGAFDFRAGLDEPRPGSRAARRRAAE
ncbi:hypothetical protein B0T44_01555, partial [Nocardia donostiensis]